MQRTIIRFLILASFFFADRVPARDEYQGIHIDVPQAEQTLQLVPPPIPLTPPEMLPQNSRVLHPKLNVRSNTSALMNAVQALDTLDAREKVFAEFPEYWSKVEKENDLNELRGQLGMTSRVQKFERMLSYDGVVTTTNILGVGNAIFQAWKANEARKVQERGFQAKVFGLIGLAQKMEKEHGTSPVISIVLAKLDFMGKKIKGKLPLRHDRNLFTENLKALAVNPVFDSTQLGPGLMEVCRLYEEYEK